MKVFEPASIGSITLSNHFIRSATAEGLANHNGFCSMPMSTFMVKLAKGGAGLIITGHLAVSREGRAGERQLCIWNDHYLPALMDMTRQVHEAGGKIVAQISHAGIFANTSLTGEAAMGPMLRQQNDATICREMTSIDIRKTVKAFANSSRLVKEAGFDGVQIHAAHGYLLSSFLSPHYNNRHDEYGGTAENRSRFLLEVVQAVRASTGSNFPVLVKMNANDFMANGIGIDDMIYTATALETSGVSAIELSGGTLESGKMVPARRGSIKPENEGYYKEEARYFKKNVGIPLILVGGFRTLSVAEQFLQEGICDFIAMARPFICEPDLIMRWKNREQNYSSCNSDNLCYLPVHAGKGLYCLTQVRKKTRPQA
jgi:2,4-dienoyl-CoA reductase-like NADH-dependent reductase (Old Yellow Enzyme family)